MAYCKNEKCEYNDDGSCEYEGNLIIDENGFCERFRYKNLKEEEAEQCGI